MRTLEERLWSDEDFWNGIKAITDLGRITIVALHIYGDNPAFPEGRERIFVRFIGDSGNIVEIPAPEEIKTYENYKQWYLVQTALNKVHLQHQHRGKKHVPFVVDCMPDFISINATRKIAPYTGVNWINEARARLYDHVTPEWLL
ncbi:hypothetical protein GCM10008910_45450 [Faecalicatena orotica]|uniref:Uncharacterized protein n=1 Tax=Faecalicatena orotica TaxID=1544 RepID=A0A2Y9BJR7_9FIRM|nr:hypothetical protein [Faecalicatena orotica]PWJ29512.1 hypothetical protein A8806_106251 [Faecalicatena orotica]SSA55967.1 hypothetical protein SAMN05216536_106251 [Faecalicatena orotica]